MKQPSNEEKMNFNEIKEELTKAPNEPSEDLSKMKEAIGEVAKTAKREAAILTTSDVKERLLTLLEEAKEPTVGTGRTEYTIDGWRLHDMIKGFAKAL